MKKAFLLLPFLTFLLCACPNNNGNSNSHAIESNDNSTINDGITTVDLDLSNFERYISYTRQEGWTGVGGWSPYEAWLEFKGLLSIGIYDVTVTYIVGSSIYNFKLDVSGGGKTDYFDRTASWRITKVSGTVTYRL